VVGSLVGVHRTKASWLASGALLLTFSVLFALPGAAAADGARASAVRNCHAHADFNILITSARNMSCNRARREMRRYKGSISRTFKTPGGFRCRRVSGGRLGGEWRCKKRHLAFRFEFGD
jgi:hypothetical protein